MESNAPERVSRKQMEAELIDKAWREPEFLQALTADPTSAIEREFGVAVPPGVKITVVEESPGQIFLVVPVNPFDNADLELTDDELEVVAGGAQGGGKSGVNLGGGDLDPTQRARIAGDRFPFGP